MKSPSHNKTTFDFNLKVPKDILSETLQLKLESMDNVDMSAWLQNLIVLHGENVLGSLNAVNKIEKNQNIVEVIKDVTPVIDDTVVSAIAERPSFMPQKH